MTEPATPRSIAIERVMPHPPEKIWRALTQGPLIAEWLMPNDFQPVVGHKFQFRSKPIAGWNGAADCEVLIVEPPRRISWTQNASGEQAANGLHSVVTWTLTPVAGGTRVHMEQTGFRTEDEAGWPRVLERLESVTAGLNVPSEETRTLTMERELAHPAEKVWRALTQSALMADWLMENDFEPVVGRRFNLRTTPMPQWNGVLDCEVLIVEPLKRLAYTWNVSGAEAANGLKTVVTFTLMPSKAGTLLRVEQSGFRAHETANFQGAQYGWQKFLGGIERVLAGLA